MRCGSHIVSACLPLMIALSATTVVRGQTPDDDFKYMYDSSADEYRPRIEADSSVFYRAVQNVGDIFADVSDYGLSFVPYARRGISPREIQTFADGIPVRAEHRSLLGRLDVERRRYSGLRHSVSSLGGVAGFTEYLSSRAMPLSSRSVSVDFSDRGYTAGLRGAVHESLQDGWSLSAAVAARTGRDLHVKGVFSNALSAGISVTKQWDGEHMFSLTALFSPSERGLRRASVCEAFTLTGDKLYNPSWGHQNGKVRNANVRRTAVPSVVASCLLPLSGNTSLSVALGADAGVVRYSSLDWFGALTPMPDNYRFLPSGYDDSAVAADVAAVWRNGNKRYTQIEWDELYERNRLADGGSVYALSDRVERITDLSARADVVTDIGYDITLGGGVRMWYSRRRNYRQMRDLLGGAHIIDTDYFLVDDATYGNMLQNDLRHPDRMVREGDRYAFDYACMRRGASAYISLSRRRDRSRLDVAAELGTETVWRRGYFEKEIFAGALSFGRSRRMRFAPYTVKASYGYSFTPRHYLELCGAVCGRTPEAEDLFLQTRYNNRTTDNPRLRTDYAAELDYTFLHRRFNLRATLFAAALLDGCEVSHYYDDLAGEYCDMTVTDIDRLNAGVELAATVHIARHWDASVSVAAARYAYISDPRVSLYADNDNRVVCNRAVARMSGCTAGSSPQFAAAADAVYRNRGWGVRLRINFAALRYVEPQAMRRTDRVSRAASVSEEIFRRFVVQERLPDAVTADAALWKSFRVKASSASRIVASLSVDNIIGNPNIVYSARESLRVRRTYVADGYLYEPFPSTRLYAYPRTVRLSVSYRF